MWRKRLKMLQISQKKNWNAIAFDSLCTLLESIFTVLFSFFFRDFFFERSRSLFSDVIVMEEKWIREIIIINQFLECLKILKYYLNFKRFRAFKVLIKPLLRMLCSCTVFNCALCLISPIEWLYNQRTSLYVCNSMPCVLLNDQSSNSVKIQFRELELSFWDMHWQLNVPVVFYLKWIDFQIL